MTAADVARDPVNELYDRGCDLVEAATAIRHAAAFPEAASAAPAVLGCIETTLEQLAHASAALEVVAAGAAEPPRDGRDGRGRVETSRRHMRRGFTNLERGLRDASELAAAARALTARALSRAGVTRRA